MVLVLCIFYIIAIACTEYRPVSALKHRKPFVNNQVKIGGRSATGNKLESVSLDGVSCNFFGVFEPGKENEFYLVGANCNFYG